MCADSRQPSSKKQTALAGTFRQQDAAAVFMAASSSWRSKRYDSSLHVMATSWASSKTGWCSAKNEGMTLMNHPTGGFLIMRESPKPVDSISHSLPIARNGQRSPCLRASWVDNHYPTQSVHNGLVPEAHAHQRPPFSHQALEKAAELWKPRLLLGTSTW